MAYTKPQQSKYEGSEKLRGEREIRSSLLILDLQKTFMWIDNDAVSK